MIRFQGSSCSYAHVIMMVFPNIYLIVISFEIYWLKLLYVRIGYVMQTSQNKPIFIFSYLSFCEIGRL